MHPTILIDGRPYRLDKPVRLTKLQKFVAANYHRGADVLASELNRTPIAVEFAYARAKRAMRARDAMLSPQSVWRCIYDTGTVKRRAIDLSGSIQAAIVEFDAVCPAGSVLVEINHVTQ